MIDFSQINNKQRIVVIGTDGTSEITKIAAHVLTTIKKPFDYYIDQQQNKIDDRSPVILIAGGQPNSVEELLKYQHHIVVFHYIKDTSNDNISFEEEFKNYDILADKTPKGGVIVYNKEDNLSMVVGTQKDREDVRLKEYGSLKCSPTANGFKLENGTEVASSNKHFPSIAGAAMELVSRISVTEEQFLEAMNTYKEK